MGVACRSLIILTGNLATMVLVRMESKDPSTQFILAQATQQVTPYLVIFFLASLSKKTDPFACRVTRIVECFEQEDGSAYNHATRPP